MGPSPKTLSTVPGGRNLIPIFSPLSHLSLAQQAEDAGLHPPGPLRRPPLPHSCSCGGLPPSPSDAACLSLPCYLLGSSLLHPATVTALSQPDAAVSLVRPAAAVLSKACTRHYSTLL